MNQKVVLGTTTLPRLVELSKIVHKGLYKEGEEITLEQWYDPDNLTQSAKQTVTWALLNYWNFAQQELRFGFVVLHDGEVVGSQTDRQAGSKPASPMQHFETGSYLSPKSRGQHIGTLSRWGILAFLFNIAGVGQVTSHALTTNHASNRVSQKTGHTPNGIVVKKFRGEQMRTMQNWKITQNQWYSIRPENKPNITITGAEQFAEDLQNHIDVLTTRNN